MANPSGRVLLARYLKAHAIKVSVAAKALGVSPAAIFQWREGLVVPRLEHRNALAVWSSGAIAAESWPVKARAIVPYMPQA